MRSELDCHLETMIPALSGTKAPDLLVATPFLSSQGLDRFLKDLDLKSLVGSRWLVRWDAEVALRGVTDGSALLRLITEGAEVRASPRLHAKVYIARSRAVVYGSANLSLAGLRDNDEIVRASNEGAEVERAIGLYESWWAKASEVSRDRIEVLMQLFPDPTAASVGFDQWFDLASLGAFVSVTWRLVGANWRVAVPWKTFGLGRPSLPDGVLAPSTLLAVPESIHRKPDSTVAKCTEWARKNGVTSRRHGVFLTVAQFWEFDELVRREEAKLNEQLRTTPREVWAAHRERCLDEVRRWLSDACEREGRETAWVDDALGTLAVRMPKMWPPGAHVRIQYSLSLPHPLHPRADWDDVLRLGRKAAAGLSQQPLFRDGSLP